MGRGARLQVSWIDLVRKRPITLATDLRGSSRIKTTNKIGKRTWIPDFRVEKRPTLFELHSAGEIGEAGDVVLGAPFL